MWIVFVKVDGHKRRQTSRSVVRNKIQIDRLKEYYICILKFTLHMIKPLGNNRVVHDKTILQSICSVKRYVKSALSP